MKDNRKVSDMAATQSQVRKRTQSVYRSNGYVQGNTVRKINTYPNRKQDERRQKNAEEQRKNAARNRDKAKHMNIGYVLFLSVALLMIGYILISYIGLQSDITNSMKNIAKLERELNNLRLENDEEYSRITSSIDLEEVKRIAIQELGMTYAQEGQIIPFSGESKDYVRQTADIIK